MVARGPEKLAESMLRNTLEEQGWWTIKLHGNVYQVGLPDLLLHPPRTLPPCCMMLVEVKVLPRRKLDVCARDVLSLLKGAQVGTWTRLVRRRAPAFVIAFHTDAENWYAVHTQSRLADRLEPLTTTQVGAHLCAWC